MNLLIIAPGADINYCSHLRSLLQGHTGYLETDRVLALAEYLAKIRRNKINAIICCSEFLLKKLIYQQTGQEDKKADLKAHSGTVFNYLGIPWLILPSPKQLITVPHVRFVFKIWLKKILNPAFPSFPKLDWTIVNQNNVLELYEEFQKAILIAVDIETTKEIIDSKIHEENPEEYQGIWIRGQLKKTSKKVYNFIPKITVVGYCGLFKRIDGSYYSKSIVIYINSMDNVTWMRKFNVLPAAKILQNGGYDCSYFVRYNAPLDNYLWDTFILMHSWLVELPRDLAYITSLFDKNSQYWKDESEDNLALYNAKDTHNTLWNFIHIMQALPQWAKNNYAENFRMQFPCITCGLDGLLVDEKIKEDTKKERLTEVEHQERRLGNIIFPEFNPRSSKQVLTLMHGLGFSKINGRAVKNADAKMLQKFKEAHPLYEFFANLITQIREDSKAVSTYFNTTLFNGRLLYELNPGGTDSGRLASKASNFWCGNQIQNQPAYAKHMIIVDKGWLFAAIDNGQSESRCTAYISEDSNLINTVEDDADFHKVNASLFFGLPMEKITKTIRNTAKRVNHGSNYNMGWYTLWETMGTKSVLQAKKLLGLPVHLNIKSVCTYLLGCFDKAYPDIKGKYYPEVVNDILLTGKLVGATGWTRRCFGDPTKSKSILNSYVSHAPQSLSVKIINAAFFDMWLKLQIKENKIRMKAQIHDEIFYMYKKEDEEYCTKTISDRMKQGTLVNGRLMVIPNDPIVGGKCWADLAH